MDAQDILRLLELKPLPVEGGHFLETYRSSDSLAAKNLPERYTKSHNLMTATYFMLTRHSYAALHRLKSDEIFHFYLGAPVTLVLLYEDGNSDLVILGSDLEAGQVLQAVVPKGTWQGALIEHDSEHDFALLGSTIAPGFDSADLETANHEQLMEQYPEHAELIQKLTRKHIIPIHPITDRTAKHDREQ